MEKLLSDPPSSRKLTKNYCIQGGVDYAEIISPHRQYHYDS